MSNLFVIESLLMHGSDAHRWLDAMRARMAEDGAIEGWDPENPDHAAQRWHWQHCFNVHHFQRAADAISSTLTFPEDGSGQELTFTDGSSVMLDCPPLGESPNIPRLHRTYMGNAPIRQDKLSDAHKVWAAYVAANGSRGNQYSLQSLQDAQRLARQMRAMPLGKIVAHPGVGYQFEWKPFHLLFDNGGLFVVSTYEFDNALCAYRAATA